MMPRLLAISTASLLAACAVPASRSGPAWSLPVQGLQARFHFEPGDEIDDTRITRTFIELRNVSDTWGPLYLLFDESACLLSELCDAAGRPRESSPALASIMFSPPYFVCIPCHASIRLDVTAYGWSFGKGSKAIVGLHDNHWAIARSDTTPCFLRGTFSARAPSEEALERLRAVTSDLPGLPFLCTIQHIWSGTLEIPRTSVDVLD